MTYRSMLPSAVIVDEVLAKKGEPEVAERRTRFRRVVVGAMGACGAICVLALAVSAVQALGEPEAKAQTRIAIPVAAPAPPAATPAPAEVRAVADATKPAEAKTAAWDGTWGTSWNGPTASATTTAHPAKAGKGRPAPRKAAGKRR